jgi:hypothetical protein
VLISLRRNIDAESTELGFHFLCRSKPLLSNRGGEEWGADGSAKIKEKAESTRKSQMRLSESFHGILVVREGGWKE